MFDVSTVAECGTLSVISSVDVVKPRPLPFESKLTQPERTNAAVMANSRVMVLFMR